MFGRQKKLPRKLRPKRCKCGHDLVIVEDYIQQQGDESRLNPTPPGKCLCGRDIEFEYEPESDTGETEPAESVAENRIEPPTGAADVLVEGTIMATSDSGEIPTTSDHDESDETQQRLAQRETALVQKELRCEENQQEVDRIKKALEDERKRAQQLHEDLQRERVQLEDGRVRAERQIQQDLRQQRRQIQQTSNSSTTN